MSIKEYVKSWFKPKPPDLDLERKLEELRKKAPVPVFWLFGKTQSGKTTVVKYLTGADEAEIGAGFKPTTRFSREYQFPSPEAPLLTFLDTRGLDEPGYDSDEDIARFNDHAHVVIVTARVMDHAQERVLTHLRKIRDAKRDRPIVLVLTCLHEAYPQQQHVQPYPFAAHAKDELPNTSPGSIDLRRSIEEQTRRFGELVNAIIPVDITKPEEGFNDPHYGGPEFKAALISFLPEAYRQTLVSVEAATGELREYHEQRAMPHILGYSTLAATAGAIPIPWVDLLILPGIQTKMLHEIAKVYGQPMTADRFKELAGSVGMGLLIRQAVREVAKFIPGVGPVVGAALAASSTYALGKACCYYYSEVLAGHIPKAEDIRAYYQKQLSDAERLWNVTRQAAKNPETQPTDVAAS